jgi:hypothetical protein
LPGTFNVLELPLNIMDTALFYPKRMGLSEPKALNLCTNIIDEVRTYGGVLTINWHTRSLSPERNWDGFYIELLRILKSQNAWFATCTEAIKWFEKRRSAHFSRISLTDDTWRVILDSPTDNSTPDLIILDHRPQDSGIAKGSQGSRFESNDHVWYGKFGSDA